MTRTLRSDWLVPLSLIPLSAVPVAAGLYRVMMLLSGGPVNQDTARFFAFPLSIIVHVFSTGVFCTLGALQFSRPLRRGCWHATAGKLVWASGCVAAVSGLWLTLIFPPVQHDGSWLFAIRLMAASGLLFCLLKGLGAVLRQDFAQHRGWMIRGYGLGIGTGTQAFTHLPLLFFPESATELSHTLYMAAGWMIKLLVAEWIVRSGKNKSRRARGSALA